MTITYKGIQPGRSGKLYDSETLTYLFLSDNPNDSFKDVLQHPQCPRIYEKHPVYQWMYAAAMSYTQGGNKEWIKWSLQVEYKMVKESEFPTGTPSPLPPPTASAPPDPLPIDRDDPESPEIPDFEPHITIGFEDFTAPISDAYTTTASQTRAFGAPITRGVPIVASNLEVYDPPPIVNKVDPIIDIRRNVLTTSTALSELPDLNNSINIFGLEYRDDAYVLKVPPRCGRFRYTLQPVQEYRDAGGSFRYRELNIQIAVKQDSWLLRLLDIGSYAFSTTGTKTIADRFDTDPPDFEWPTGSTPLAFKKDNGEPHLRLLDGKGNELGDGIAPVYNEYKGYREQDFLPFLKKFTKAKFFRS